MMNHRSIHLHSPTVFETKVIYCKITGQSRVCARAFILAVRLLSLIKKHCDRPCLRLDGNVLAGFSVLSKARVLRIRNTLTRAE